MVWIQKIVNDQMKSNFEKQQQWENFINLTCMRIKLQWNRNINSAHAVGKRGSLVFLTTAVHRADYKLVFGGRIAALLTVFIMFHIEAVQVIFWAEFLLTLEVHTASLSFSWSCFGFILRLPLVCFTFFTGILFLVITSS